MKKEEVTYEELLKKKPKRLKQKLQKVKKLYKKQL